jgi:phosphoribosylanthranilate isomerase
MTRPRIKICGITRAADAQLAVELGADAVGFVLWPRSPRAITPVTAAHIAEGLPAFVTRVGVVVDMPPAELSAIASGGAFDAVQLHGDEIPSRYADVPLRLIKAVSVVTDADVERALALPASVTIIVDAADREKRGGTGQRASWTLAAAIARRRPVILAGGLTPENVGEAIERVKPWAVDVSSGVEETPGVKNPRLLEAFIRAVAGAISV